MSVTVEFFGLPGAGKTTLATAFADRMGERFVNSSETTRDKQSKWSRRLNKAWLLMANGLNARLGPVLRLAWQVRQSSLSNKVKSLAPLTTFLCLKAHYRARQQSALFDHGFLQSIFSLVYGAVDETEAKRAIADLTASVAKDGHLYVIVDTPVDVCRQRVGRRANNHSRLASDDDANWAKSAGYFNAIKDALLEHSGGGPQVLSVDGTAPLDTVVEDIATWIEACVRDSEISPSEAHLVNNNAI